MLRGAVVEVGRARGQAAHAGNFEFADVGAFAGDHCASRIGGVSQRAIVALNQVQRGGQTWEEPVPMFIMPNDELPPTFGVLWQVVQVPVTWVWP